MMKHPLLIFILNLVVAALVAKGVPQVQLERWVHSGIQSFQWDQLDRCIRASPHSGNECRRFAHLSPSAVTVYTSEPRTTTAGISDKVLAILPDSYSSSGLISSKFHDAFSIGPIVNRRARRHRYQLPLPGSMTHDVVLVLDPTPSENFGHPVALFYVDLNVTKKRCSHMDGIYMGNECLTQVLKGRCQNQMKHWQTTPERLMGHGHSWLVGGVPYGTALSNSVSERLCEVHFLPLVVGAGDNNRTQRLRCVDHRDFSRCPQLVPIETPSMPISSCELNKNTRRCHQQPVSTRLSCRLYQTCDHAILISGGWRQQMTFQQHVQNLQRFYRMLRINGFQKDHIKTFFASSGHILEKLEGAYSATEKTAIRSHVSYVCRKQHCADSFVLYLNSPTRNDGTMLLWDANFNGIADLKERYSVNELLTDLAGCMASRVFLFVDQSYSGVLSKRLRSSQKHLNVVLIQREIMSIKNYQTQVDHSWEDNTWTHISPSTCLLDHLSTGASHFLDQWAGILNITLAGAPCNVTPPLTESEMRRWYQGCQNLPTALWHRKYRRIN
ncbi:uncharacterized protein LOC144204664 [Stigmatopora nigra]